MGLKLEGLVYVSAAEMDISEYEKMHFEKMAFKDTVKFQQFIERRNYTVCWSGLDCKCSRLAVCEQQSDGKQQSYTYCDFSYHVLYLPLTLCLQLDVLKLISHYLHREL